VAVETGHRDVLHDFKAKFGLNPTGVLTDVLDDQGWHPCIVQTTTEEVHRCHVS
jgi:hypothetical protein